MNNDVVIVSACRIAIGKFGGMYANTSALELTIPVMQQLIKRAGIDPSCIDDCIWGCNYQKTNGENNLARVALVKAGLPITVPGITETVHHPCRQFSQGIIRLKRGRLIAYWLAALTV